jgi:uncharacterized protein (DUF488 family)
VSETAHRILTAGYGNRGFEGFVELVKTFGVTHLVDVRSVPQSAYWTDFRRENLEKAIPPTGLVYVYMGDTLGGVLDSPSLCKEPETVELHPLFHEPRFRLGLDRLIRAAASPDRVICLMCGCLRPHQCHRSRLIAEALGQLGIPVSHVDHEGNLVSQETVRNESQDPQLSLF